MAGVQETAQWENHVYRIEENDPVHGGEDGVTNKPIKHLANRTLYLRKLLTEAGQRINPKKITATTRNSNDLTGHTHEIDLASLTTKGLVQLTNDTGLDSELLALTAKGGKAIAQSVAQTRLDMANGLNQKVNKTDISDAVNSSSKTTVASSQAVKTAYDLANAAIPNSKKSDSVTSNSADTVATSLAAKTAYDKALEAKNIADGKVGIAGTETITGEKTFHYNIKIRSNHDTSKLGRIGHNGQDLFIQNGYTGHYLTLKNDGELRYREWAIHHENRPYATVKATNAGYAGLNVSRTGTNGNWESRLEALPDRRWKFWTNSDGGGFEQYIPAKNGTIALMDDVNARVSKSGDTMTGVLNIKSGDYSAVRTYNAAGWSVRWEAAPQVANHFAAIVQANNNESVVIRALVPKKSGTLLLDSDGSIGVDANTYVQRDGSGDVIARLLRTTYQDEERLQGAIAFRINNSNDNYTRYCNSPAAVRNWLDLNSAIPSIVKSAVSRSTKSRTINGNSADDSGTTRQMQLTGEVIVYPDGKIEQTFHLKQFRDFWFAREDGGVGIHNNNDWGRIIPITLWTAMPNKVTYVNAQIMRSSDTALSAMYSSEAREQVASWAIRKQGSNKGQVWVDIARISGNNSEHIDLFVKVEGY